MVISYKCVAVAVIFPPLGREGSEEEMGLFWVFGFAWLRGLNSVQLTLCPSEQSVMMLPFQDPKPYPPPSSELQCLLAAGEAPRRMQIGFKNKGSTSRLREQRYDPKFGDLWPVYAMCSWLLQLCWWLYVGEPHRPKPCPGVVHSKSHCPEAGGLPESYLWSGRGRGRRRRRELVLSPGGLL